MAGERTSAALLAICSGVTGTSANCFGSVSTPLRLHVITTLSPPVPTDVDMRLGRSDAADARHNAVGAAAARENERALVATATPANRAAAAMTER